MDVNYLINQGYEIRSIELRAEPDPNSRLIKGTSIVFNSESELMRAYRNELNTTVLFREIVLPEAATMEFLQQQDIVMLYNHLSNDEDVTTILARNNKGVGNLKYTVDSTGVHFEFEALNTEAGTAILEAVRSRIITACSFCFQLTSDGEKWINAGDGTYKRYISSIAKIHDFSLVQIPAYPETSVNTRGLIELIEAETRNLEAITPDEEEEKETIKVTVEVEVEITKVEVEEETPIDIVNEIETDDKAEERKLELDNYYKKYRTLFSSINLN